MGRKLQARQALQRYYAVHPASGPDPTGAIVMAAMGDKDGAIAWLQNAYAHHSSVMMALKVDHAFDPLRGDPRFEDLVRRVGLSR